MSIIKLITTVSLAVALLIMITSIQLPIYASPTTEDDGEFIPDDATEEEKEDIEDEGQQAWEDAGRPGDTSNNDDDDDDTNDLPRCAYEVVRDCVLNDLGQKCEVGTDEDACQDVFYGWDVNGDNKIDNKDKEACEKPEIAVCNTGKDSGGSKSGGSSSSQPQPQQTTTDCDTWSYDLDIKLAAVNAKTELLNSQYDDAQTDKEIDKYNAQVDKVNAEVTAVSAEVDKFNAECAT
jgi:hypothetical protein